MKGKKSYKKYPYENNISDTLPNHTHVIQIREQLRQCLEQLEQSKLTNELESQKRILAEHQYQKLKDENAEVKCEMEGIKKELAKLSRKYSKMRESQVQSCCEKCKERQEGRESAERERQIFMKERGILKNEIKELKRGLEIAEPLDCGPGASAATNRALELLRKQSYDKGKAIEEQKKIIRYLDDKLSLFQVQKLQTLNFVESIDQKLQELQMENNILKGFSIGREERGGKRERERERQWSFMESPNRRNGSIKNLEQANRSRARDSPKY